MPAADMVLGPWDAPDDFIPVPKYCGPLDYARENTVSTYVALFRPVSPGPVIISQALVLPKADQSADYVEGAMQELVNTHNTEFVGPPLGRESHYFEGKLDGNQHDRYTALWRYERIFCELSVAGPPGAFNVDDLHHYASVQDRRVKANLPQV
jgi:hypothetical protein